MRVKPSACLLFIALYGCSTTSGVRVSTTETLPAGTERIDITMGLRRDPALSTLLSEISAARMRETDSILVSFGTRHTMSDTTSATRGIGAARRFLHQTLTGYSRECGGCLSVELDDAIVEVTRHPQRPRVNVVNVLA